MLCNAGSSIHVIMTGPSAEHCSKRNAIAQHQNKGLLTQCIPVIDLPALYYQTFIASPAFSFGVTTLPTCMDICNTIGQPLVSISQFMKMKTEYHFNISRTMDWKTSELFTKT